MIIYLIITLKENHRNPPTPLKQNYITKAGSDLCLPDLYKSHFISGGRTKLRSSRSYHHKRGQLLPLSLFLLKLETPKRNPKKHPKFILVLGGDSRRQDVPNFFVGEFNSGNAIPQ